MADPPAANLEMLRRLNEAGYQFYRDPARLREDDLLVRSRAADMLHLAAAHICLAEQRARRALPPPSREHPVPDAASLAAIRALKLLQDDIAALETRLRGPAALPDSDFSTLTASESLRQTLVFADAALLDRAEALQSGAQMPAAPGFAILLSGVEKTISNRTAITARGEA